jgi:hypothetical protein
MRTALLTFPLLALLMGAPAAAWQVAGAGPALEAEQAFRLAVARARGPRTGDVFTLPSAYNYVSTEGYDDEDVAHIPGRGLVKVRGTYHSTCWRYDRQIPLAFYWPGQVPAGRRPPARATQQDLPATYAWLLHTLPPRDSVGRPLREAFVAHPAVPRVILTIVLDQGGRTLYAAHPGKYPHLAALMAAGADFPQAEVTNLETETAPGHVALGTGAYAGRAGLAADDFYASGLGMERDCFTVESNHSPFFLEAPTLADAWLRATRNRAIVAGLSQADRAAIGLVGHGSAYAGNGKPLLAFYDAKAGKLQTNPAYYALPPYWQGLDAASYARAFTRGSCKWLGHDVADPSAMRRSPILVDLEADAMAGVIAHEPVGQDDACDLLYVSFKSPDATGHRYGYESDEAGEVLAAVDRRVGDLVQALQAKAGEQHVLVVVTADHGATPLPELSGGTRLRDTDLLARINARFKSPDPRRPAALYATTGQVWLDRRVLDALHATPAQVADFLRALRIDGKPFYRLVIPA